ncbi:hypothetical protein B0A48_05608 [Cryoendolithus antarcticus]|uniref:CSN8/PSMD8/EIF3K domain-containing protein n=1 Tax=Cryoendolithus antarcticus TaxID=1507870 RepID=A0A1V8TJG3_9PEZI|nr:hypothetical protein B0A48_05608 [Cryoendolithus antarcticus]
MAEKELKSIIAHLQSLKPNNLSTAPSLLSRAKLALLKLDALIPSSKTSPAHLELAQTVLELGAFASIHLRDTDSFTRYYQYLQPFYSLQTGSKHGRGKKGGNREKVTGLYLLLLLSGGDYAGFHTVLEGLEGSGEESEFIAYPVRLEQALMEGSYDRVWGETKGERVPSEEFGVFSEVSCADMRAMKALEGANKTAQVLINTIRSEIASCSERAYPSLPISNAKNLLFLDSEGAVVQFAHSRGWVAKDGRIWFPEQEAENAAAERDVVSASGAVIENTLGYARKLETIV